MPGLRNGARRWKRWPVIRAASLNVPGHANKRQLVAPALRMVLALSLLWRHRRTVVGIQELSDVSRAVIRRRRRWTVIDAPPNNVIRGNRLGNAIAFRNDVWELLHARSIRVPMPGRRRGLNLPVVTLRHKATGRVVRYLCFHAPRRNGPHGDKATNHLVIRRVLTWLRSHHDQGHTAVAIGDSNNGAIYRMMRMAGATVLAGAPKRIDIVAGVHVKGLGHTEVRGKHSDHATVMADAQTKP